MIKTVYLAIYITSIMAATWAGSLISDRYWAEVVSTQKEIIAQQHQVFAVREQLLEIGYSDRLLAILNNISMECFGRWTTSDDDIVIVPMDDEKKVAQQ